MAECPSAGFRRARTEEQREVRRRAILDTALGMLEQMPVADVTLNELSRRVGLAKSNVLRYFETREAVLLELLIPALEEFLTDLERELSARRDPERTVQERAEELAAVVSRSLTNRPILCDLMNAQAAELERNVSLEVALHFTRSVSQQGKRMSDLLRRYLPELGDQADSVAILGMVLAGALSAASRPSPGMADGANRDYRSGRPLDLQLPDGLENALALLIGGGLARQNAAGLARPKDVRSGT